MASMDLKAPLVLFCLVQVFLSGLSQSQTAPEAPAGLSLQKRDTTSITISWTGSSGEYEVQVSPSAGTGGKPQSTSNDVWTYSLSGLSPGTPYEFSVTAKEANLTSTNTKETFYTVPNPPTKLTISEPRKTSTLDINWTKPSKGECSLVQISLDNEKPM